MTGSPAYVSLCDCSFCGFYFCFAIYYNLYYSLFVFISIIFSVYRCQPRCITRPSTVHTNSSTFKIQPTTFETGVALGLGSIPICPNRINLFLNCHKETVSIHRIVAVLTDTVSLSGVSLQEPMFRVPRLI